MNHPLAPETKIMLDQERTMVFDAVTYCAFEEQTGRFFFDVVADLWEALQPVPGANGQMIAPTYTAVLRKVSIKEITTLLWAALHTYDANDNPVRELSLKRVQRMVHQGNLMVVLNNVLRGNAANSPTVEEVGEDAGQSKPETVTTESTGRPVVESAAMLPGDENGGTTSGDSHDPEPVLAFRSENSGD